MNKKKWFSMKYENEIFGEDCFVFMCLSLLNRKTFSFIYDRHVYRSLLLICSLCCVCVHFMKDIFEVYCILVISKRYVHVFCVFMYSLVALLSSFQVRKKSAKVLEMEEFEGLEKKAHAKISGSKSAKKQVKAKSGLSPVVEFPGVQSHGSPSALQNLLNSPVAGGAATLQQLPISSIAPCSLPSAVAFSPPLTSAPVADSLKLKLNLSAMAASQNPLVSPPGQLPPPPPSKSEKKAKAKASKKTKIVADFASPVPPSLGEDNQMKQELDTGLKLKLKIPSSAETPKSPLREQLSQKLQPLSPQQKVPYLWIC